MKYILEFDFYKILAIISPFLSAILASYATYYYTLKTKRFDILYQNKIPAFKEIVTRLIELKKFCIGRLAHYEGNEYSPYYEESTGVLEHRTLLADSYELNSIFLSKSSRKSIENLLDDLSGLCNAERCIGSGDDTLNVENEYGRIAKITEDTINKLYSELNL